MGFYLRKSIKAGPFRFNLSKSGVGVSVGVPGFRIGTGPQGNYVHLGAGGLYYRSTLAPHQADRASSVSTSRVSPADRHEFRRIDSGDVLQMVDASATTLLQQIQAAESRSRYAPLVVIAFGVVGLFVGGAGYPTAALATWLFGGIAASWVHLKDEAARSVVLFYEMEPEAEAAFEDLHHVFQRFADTQSIWNVEAQAEVSDGRRHAGVDTLVQRRPVRLGTSTPSVIRTNIAVPAIPAGAETLYFFPDRLLVSSPRGVGAVPYDQLAIDVSVTQFVEDGPVPTDAMVVGTRWRYQNRDGSPDRRFSDNREIPLVMYEEIQFTSPTGLNEVLQLSRTGGGESFRSAVAALARLGAQKLGQNSPPIANDSAVRDNGEISLAPGTFRARITGDLDFASEGSAVYGVLRNEDATEVFMITLRHDSREGDGDHAITFSNRLTGPPLPGKYLLGEMGPQSFVAIYSHVTEGGSVGTYSADDGCLEMLQSDTRVVNGRFEFRGEGTNNYNLWAVEGQARIVGAFAAVLVEDPWELAKLPGMDVSREELDEGDSSVSSFAEFIKGVIENIVEPIALSSLLKTLEEHGYNDREIRRAEAFLFAVFPVDVFAALPHFDDLSDAVRTMFRAVAAERVAEIAGLSVDVAEPLVAARFAEYAKVAFNSDGLTLRQEGLERLAQRAHGHITGKSTSDLGLVMEIYTQFTSFSESWEYGAKLRELYDQYDDEGDAMWV